MTVLIITCPLMKKRIRPPYITILNLTQILSDIVIILLTTPNSVIDFNVEDHSKEVKKEQEVLGGKFDKENYISERIWASTRDGKKVAVSVVYHKSTVIVEDTPLLLYAYGSYGSIVSDRFSTVRLSLLDRGFVYAVAHVRGGEYLGRHWYDEGKMFAKKNTFYDYIDAAKHLIEHQLYITRTFIWRGRFGRRALSGSRCEYESGTIQRDYCRGTFCRCGDHDAG